MSGKHNRSKIQRDRDLATIAELRLKGWTQQQIADYLEVNQATISRDLKALEQQWKESSLRDFDAERGMQLDRLELLEREYWQAWERSQESKQVSMREQLRNAIASEEGTTAGSGRVRMSTRTEEKIGDPQFLSGVAKVITERSKLLGLYPDGQRDRSAEATLKDYLEYLSAKQDTPDASADQ
ncbi:HTH domain-containing protein [Cyanobacteria bacterium FACHB-63]|nr:HTH domain-containing protein [Cyanobacteria bacterium FACHB-63]